MRHAAVPRSELGVKTCFNMLGPMTNPAGVRRQLIGAYSPSAASLIADVFAGLDPLSVLVVHGDDGLDEISLAAPTTAHHVTPGGARPKTETLTAGDFGLPAHTVRLPGGGPHENARIARAVLSGEKGPERDVVVANAAAALVGFSLSVTFVVTLALPPILSPHGEIHRLAGGMFTISYTCAVIIPVICGAFWDVTGIPWTAFIPVGLCGITLTSLGFFLSMRNPAR